MRAEKPREIAALVLKRFENGEGYTEDLLEQHLRLNPLSPLDRGLVHEIVFGVVRWRLTLDWLIAAKTHGRTQKLLLQILLRMGLYQMLWLDRVPDHAAVHETVELAKQLGFGPQAGFINAILRGYAREKDAARRQLQDLKTAQPALGYSHPPWLYDRWLQRWGAEQTKKLLEWNNQSPPVYARVNSLRTNATALQERWHEEKVDALARQWDWTEPGEIFELLSHPALTTLPSFQEGLFYVQDPSTLLAVRLLDPQPGEAILDTCAAPGGKTTLIAQRMDNRGYIMAQDIDVRRRQRIKENCERLGIRCVQIAKGTDALNPELSQPFDRILIDAPCSNTGVLRRRVELRWRLEQTSLDRLTKVQLGLLEQSVPQLNPGGTLVYSTCSLEPEENQAVVGEFLKLHSDYALETERELLPFRDGVDGAYVAKLKKQ